MAMSWSEPFEVDGDWRRVGDSSTEHVAGRLVYSPSDGLRLLVSGSPRLIPNPQSNESIAVVGLCQGTYWTLGDCRFKSSSSRTGEELLVGYALAGLGLDETELNSLDEIRVSFDGLWAVVGTPRGRGSLDRRDLSVSGRATDDITICIESELVDLPSTFDDVSSVRDRLVFIGRVANPTSFRQLHKLVVGPLHSLVTLALQRGASINYCDVSGPGTDVTGHVGRTRRERAVVYWNSVGSPTREDLLRETVALKLPIDDVGFERFAVAWFDQHERLGLPLGLRLADLIAGMTFAPTRFVLVAQALEALHRRLHPEALNAAGENARTAALAATDPEHREVLEILLSHAHEPTFRQRLKELVAEAEPQITEIVGDRLKEAVTSLVTARNDVTHWSGDDEPDGLRLVALRMVADALFDVVLLKRVGLSDDELIHAVRLHQSRHVEYWLHRALEDA
jgi:hypothetical protein